jgi:hypothetical protein
MLDFIIFLVFFYLNIEFSTIVRPSQNFATMWISDKRGMDVISVILMTFVL